jgi:phosphoribosylaminoimidazolecarboxamide formyltransferase/IMP cyclohydrolase
VTTKRALLSLSDKKGLLPLARGLSSLGWELLASEDTARALATAGLAAAPISPLASAAQRLREHLQPLAPPQAPTAAPFDLVVCNLPLALQATRTDAEAMAQIDLDGVALLRAAATGFAAVAVLCDPADYEAALEAIRKNSLTIAARRGLALKAFRHTAAYDAAIASWLARGEEGESPLPGSLRLSAERVQVLRYGENPHQQGALYGWSGEAPGYEALQGKELSYNNLLDLDAAWAAVTHFARPAVAIIKQGNPCGLAQGEGVVSAFGEALASDPVSAFEAVIAVNRPATAALVEALGELSVEVLAAPSWEPEALALLSARKKNCRAVRASTSTPSALSLRAIRGGLLAQTPDLSQDDESDWVVVSQRQPTPQEWRSLRMAWSACRFVKSNAIVLTQGDATVGVGAGQMSRVDAVRLAVERAGERARGAAMGSDAFFPFEDGVEAAAAGGVTAVIQPGGARNDAAVLAAADRLGMVMIFTGRRHFLR